MRDWRPGIRKAGVSRDDCRALHRSGKHLPCRADLGELGVGDGRTGGDVGVSDVGDGGRIDELVKFLSKGPEAVCGMCPANIENYEKDIYNVNFVQKGIHRMERPKPAPAQIAQAE